MLFKMLIVETNERGHNISHSPSHAHMSWLQVVQELREDIAPDLAAANDTIENPLARLSRSSSSQSQGPVRHSRSIRPSPMDRLLQSCSSLGSSFENSSGRREGRRYRGEMPPRTSRLRDGLSRDRITPVHGEQAALRILLQSSWPDIYPGQDDAERAASVCILRA